MAANFRKILFEGSKVEIAQISASNIPETASSAAELEVLTIDPSTGEVRFISQSELQTPNGDVTFGISGSDLTGVPFDSNGERLLITTNNPDYLSTSITPGTNAVTASFNIADNFITGSGQLNAINYSVSSFGIVSPAGSPSDFRTAFHTPIVGLSLFGFGNPQVGSILHNTNAIQEITTNPTVVTLTNGILSKVINDGPYTASIQNLWFNPLSTTDSTPVSNASISNLNPDTLTANRDNYAWLSASLVGGFTQGGVPSLSASFVAFTSSLATNSSSIGILQGSSSNITGTTSSMALNEFTSSFLRVLKPKRILSSFHNANISQVTIVDETSNDGTDPDVLPQGRILQIGGTVPATSPLGNFLPDARHLTISGTFTANDLILNANGIILEQMDVASFSGSINYGTSSLHTHRFIGNTFITGGGVSVTGPLSIQASLPLEDDVTLDNPVQILVRSGSNNILRATTINSANSIIDNEIRSTATATSLSFEDRVETIQDNIDLAPGQASSIHLLQSGSNDLTGSYSRGIFFGTASNQASSLIENSDGSTLGFVTHTASFSASIAIGPNTDHTVDTNIFTVSHSLANNISSIQYIFNTSSFISATNIITASQFITDTINDLDRYGKQVNLILTQSNTAGNILYIADLATNLTDGTGKHFLTGAGSFNSLLDVTDVSANELIFNQFTTTDQGSIVFDLSPDPSNFVPGNVAVSFKDLQNTNSPQFTNLTIGTDPVTDPGNLTVNGSLIKINKSNLNIKDQFILINSGTLPGTFVNVDNDPDGGIIVGNGNNSGSMFMFDNTHNRWGFIGADGNNLQALDVESNEDNTLTPKLGVRVTVFNTEKFNADGTPIDISNFEYGNSDQNTQLGIMAVCNDVTKNPDRDVYIYA